MNRIQNLSQHLSQRCIRTVAVTSSLLVLMGTLACSAKQPPLTTLGEAKMAVENAESVQAERYAQKSLSDARAKLKAANELNEKEEYTLARRHAEQAIVDAKLAQTQAELARSVGAAAEAKDALEDVQ